MILVPTQPSSPRLAGADRRLDAASARSAGRSWRARASARRLGDELVGFVDLSTDLTNGGTLSRLVGWGEIDSLYVEEPYRRRGVATWLIGLAADWLRLGHGDRLIAYCEERQDDVLAFAAALGWRELARTERGWYAG